MLDTSSIPVIDPDSVEVSNLLRQRNEPFLIEIPIGEHVLPVTFSHQKPTEALGDPITVSLDTDFGVLQLFLTPEFLEVFCDLWLEGWRNETEDALPLDWRVICVIHSLWELTTFKDTGWTVMSVERSARPPTEPGQINGSIVVGDTSFGAGLNLTAVDASKFKKLFASALPANRPVLDIDWKLSVRLPLRDLSLSETTSLGYGDVVLLAGSAETSLQARASIEGRIWTGNLGLNGTFTADTQTSEIFEMTEPAKDENDDIASVDVHVPEEIDPTEISQTEDIEDHGDDELDDLPVKLEVMFKPTFLPLSQIRSLDAGATVNLGIDLADQVQVHANEKTVGRGRLVQIGDRVGLELTHWTLNGDRG